MILPDFDTFHVKIIIMMFKRCNNSAKKDTFMTYSSYKDVQLFTNFLSSNVTDVVFLQF